MTSLSINRKFEWIITNVTKDKLLEPDFEAYSETFHLILGDNKTDWYFSLEMCETDDGIKYLRIYLWKEKVDKDNFKVKCCFALDDMTRTFKKPSVEIKTNWGYPDVITIDTLFHKFFEYVDNNGSLKIFIEIELSMAIPKTTSLYPSLNMPTSMPSYSRFLAEPKFSDFTLQSSDNAELQVHRLVLAASSSFFETLFTVDMQEKESKKVVFSDINEMTLKKVLTFAYTGRVIIVDVNEAVDVLYAAEKFFMVDLKRLCIIKLMNGILKENVLEIFVTADLYKDKKLEKKCLDFILSNYSKLRSSKEWSELKFPLLLKITDAFAILQADKEAQKITLMTKLCKN